LILTGSAIAAPRRHGHPNDIRSKYRAPGASSLIVTPELE
jgi:hypothetical protein